MILVAVAASVTSAANGFTYDDVHIILQNESVHTLSRWWQLFATSYWPPSQGGDLYRPFTMLAFAVQWMAGGGHPFAFHLVSILLYALCCGAFLWVAEQLLPLPVAWLAALLFAVHPLHVEAVGNVVGQSELWAALFMFVALGLYVRVRRRGTPSVSSTFGIAVLYLLACLSKEHGLVLPLLLAAAEITVVPRTTSIRARAAALRPLALLLVTVGLAFLWARVTVLDATSTAGAQVSVLFSDRPFAVRAMTMLRVVLEWARLFLWPAALSADYSPHHIDIVTAPTLDLMASIGILGGIAWLAWLARRTTPVATFAALWVLVGLLIPSNLLVPTEFVLAERTLFLASGGVMLGIAAFVARLAGEERMQARVPRPVWGLVAAIVVMGLVRSAVRQPVWRDNLTLFARTVRDAPASYSAHLNYGTELSRQGHAGAAFREISLAYRLYPKDLTVVHSMGQIQALNNDCPAALPFFRQVLSEDPGRSESRVALARCLIVLGQHAEASKVLAQGVAIGRSKEALLQLTAINDSLERSRPAAGRQ